MDSNTVMISAFRDDVLGTMDGVALAEKIRKGEIKAVEAVEAAIARARDVNPSLNAIVTEMFDAAVKKAGQPLSGPFAGVPSFVKDTDDVEGAPTFMGTCAVPAHKKKRTSKFLRQFMAQGFIGLGKTALPEFGLTATTEPLSSGITRNPWNPGFSTGGSSGGSAAMVASGVVPVAHGNDGGGSLRIPAACCGLVALKPTRGRVMKMDGSELMPINIVHQGMLSRTVRDTAAFYAGAEIYDRNSRLPEIGLVSNPGKKRLKIGMYTLTPFGKPCNSETAREVEKIGALCEELGHSVSEIPCPFDSKMADDFLIYWGMLAFSLRFYGKFLLQPGFDRKKIDEWTLGLSRLYQRNIFKTPFIISRLKGQGKRFNEYFNTYDVLLSPTLSHPTPEIGYIGPEVPFEEALDRVVQFCSFTPAQNVSGAPAISLPLGKSENGMPLGIQFGAAPGMERTLLELAFELEAAQPWPLINASAKSGS